MTTSSEFFSFFLPYTQTLVCSEKCESNNTYSYMSFRGGSRGGSRGRGAAGGGFRGGARGGGRGGFSTGPPDTVIRKYRV